MVDFQAKKRKSALDWISTTPKLSDKAVKKIESQKTAASFPVVLGVFGWASPVKLVGKIRALLIARTGLGTRLGKPKCEQCKGLGVWDDGTARSLKYENCYIS